MGCLASPAYARTHPLSLVLTLLASAVVADPIRDANLLNRTDPDLYRPVVCRNVTNSVVPCQRIYLLGLQWYTAGPIAYAWAKHYSYERLRLMVNHRQELLPGYELMTDWIDDKWDPVTAVSIVSQGIANNPKHYAGIVQTGAPSAPHVTAFAASFHLPHISAIIAPAAMSDRKLAPAFWRTTPSAVEISTGFLSFILQMGWKRMGVVFDPKQFPDVLPIYVRAAAARGITVLFTTPLIDYGTSLDGIVDAVIANRVRILNVWGESQVMAPLTCKFIKRQTGGIFVLAYSSIPFYLVSLASLGAGPLSDTAGPDAVCAPDKMAAWNLGTIMVTGMSYNESGRLYLQGSKSPEAGPQPLTCLPNDGANAGGEFTSWWFDQMVPLIPNVTVPWLSGADTLCLWVLLFRHLLFTLNRTAGDLSSGSPHVLQMEREFLQTAEIPHGLAMNLKFPNPFSWVGPENNDATPTYNIFQVQAGRGLGSATPSGLFDMHLVGQWPGTGFDRLAARVGNISDRIETCPPGLRRLGFFVPDNRSGVRSVSQCLPCPAGTHSQDSTQVACIPCPAGTFSLEGFPNCLACEAGHFANATGQSACQPCPPGSFQAGTQQLLCSPCPVGTSRRLPGGASCDLCPLGTFQDHTGQVGCVSCNSTFTTSAGGVASPSECVCGPGTFLESGVCSPCLAGLRCPGGNGPPLQEKGFMAVAQAPPAAAYLLVECAAPEHCPAGPINTCAEGRTGLGCGRCKAHFHAISVAACTPCPTWAPVVATLSLVGGLGLSLILVLVSRTDVSSFGAFSAMTIASQIIFQIEALAVYERLGAGAVDGISVLTNLLSLSLETAYWDCVWHLESPVRSFIPRFFVVPVIAALVVLWCIVAKLLKFHVGMDNCINAVGQAFLTMNLSLMFVAFLPFQCKHNTDGTLRWSVNPQVVCFQDEHQGLVVISCFALMLFPIAMMAVIVYVTCQYQRWVSSPSGMLALRRFRFLFNRYSNSAYYFCVVEIFRDTLLGISPILIMNRVEWQNIFVGCVMVVNLAVQCRVWPFSTQVVNLATVGTMVGLIVVMISRALASLVVLSEAGAATQIVTWIWVGSLGALALYITLWAARGKLCGGKPYVAFLCHHKQGAGSLARLLKMMLAQQMRGNVFLDSDDLQDLDHLVDCVRHKTSNLLVLLTPEVLTRPWCAAEIATAHMKGVPIVPVICDGFESSSRASWTHRWSPEEEETFAGLDLSVASVETAYQALASIPPVTLSLQGDPQLVETTVSKIAQRCQHGLWVSEQLDRVQEIFPKAPCDQITPTVLLVGDSGDLDHLATLVALQVTVQRMARLETVVLRSPDEVERALESLKFLVVVLTKDLLVKENFAAIMVKLAPRSPNFKIVLARADPSFTFPPAEFFAKIRAEGVGSAVPAAAGTLLADFYQSALHVIAVPLSPHGSQKLWDIEVQQICERLQGVKERRGSSSQVRALPHQPQLTTVSDSGELELSL